MDSVFKALVLPITIFITVIIVGTFGYMTFAHIGLVDALQLVVVTIATCGLRPAGTVTSAAKIFDISFIVISFIVMIAVISRAFSLILEGELKGIREREKMRKTLLKIKDHYVVCGFGRVGSQVVKQLLSQKIPVVVIDSKPDTEAKLQSLKIPYVLGSLSSDEVLQKARVDRAQGLVVCADSDIENVFGTLAARTINPTLKIIARASDPSNEDKLKRAGADHVVSPYLTTGQKISSMILNPSVADFLDKVMHDQSLEVWFQEVRLPKKSKLAGKTLKEIDLRQKTGVIILAIKHPDGKFDLSPDANTKLHGEDTFICIGTNAQIASLKKLF
jgi:voltage-gated potassium channel